MRYIVAIAISILMLTACKKKESKPNTTMTITSDLDSTWTVSSVEAHSTTANTISISATNTKINAQIKIGLYDYRDGNKSYAIDYRTAEGSLNSATYSSGAGRQAVASLGSVTLNNFTTKTMSGSFSFTGPGGSVSGTFVAPRP